MNRISNCMCWETPKTPVRKTTINIKLVNVSLYFPVPMNMFAISPSIQAVYGLWYFDGSEYQSPYTTWILGLVRNLLSLLVFTRYRNMMKITCKIYIDGPNKLWCGERSTFLILNARLFFMTILSYNKNIHDELRPFENVLEHKQRKIHSWLNVIINWTGIFG